MERPEPQQMLGLRVMAKKGLDAYDSLSQKGEQVLISERIETRAEGMMTEVMRIKDEKTHSDV